MRLLSLVTVLALSGCTVGPDYIRPDIALTPAFQGSAAIETAAQDGDWWRGFNDPVLSALVERAVAKNLDVAKAGARIAQSRAVAKAAGAALLPSVDATGGVSTVSQSRETPVGRVTTALGVPRGYTQYEAGGSASWEIDLCGGLRRGREAARAELGASEMDAAAVRVAVAAETADAYLSLRALQARLGVAEGQTRNQALLLDLIQRRFAEGVSAEREVNRTRAALEGVEASAAPIRAGIAAQMNRIDVLVGEQPGSNRALLAQAAEMPSAPAPSGSARPEDILRRRPDVAAAERRLAASNARIGQAAADYYPHISLSGLLAVASIGTSRLLTGGAVQASGTAGLRWRLFDFGRVDAEVAQARGRQAEELAAWRGSVLRAAEDVETALSKLAEAHVQRAGLERQVAALTLTRRQAQDAYQGGVVALIEVTDANRDLLDASDLLVNVRGEEARAAVTAYRALGGGWRVDGAQGLALQTARHM